MKTGRTRKESWRNGGGLGWGTYVHDTKEKEMYRSRTESPTSSSTSLSLLYLRTSLGRRQTEHFLTNQHQVVSTRHQWRRWDWSFVKHFVGSPRLKHITECSWLVCEGVKGKTWFPTIPPRSPLSLGQRKEEYGKATPVTPFFVPRPPHLPLWDSWQTGN